VVLETAQHMGLWMSVAVMLLSSPRVPLRAPELSADVLSPALVQSSSRGAEPSSETQLRTLLLNLAVVRPSGALAPQPSSLLVFVVVVPDQKGGVGLRLFGSF